MLRLFGAGAVRTGRAHASGFESDLAWVRLGGSYPSKASCRLSRTGILFSRRPQPQLLHQYLDGDSNGGRYP
jgi:hypothetical protein